MTPRSILNCATSWMALSFCADSSPCAHVCQYVVPSIERAQQHDPDDRDPADAVVHAALDWARLETSSSSASMTKFETMLEPP